MLNTRRIPEPIRLNRWLLRWEPTLIRDWLARGGDDAPA
jgi:hypothetical protein